MFNKKFLVKLGVLSGLVAKKVIATKSLRHYVSLSENYTLNQLERLNSLILEYYYAYCGSTSAIILTEELSFCCLNESTNS